MNTKLKKSLGVIIPVYNSLPYLQDLRLSLDKQTGCDLHIILVNDGSTDDSGIFLKEWEEQDARVTLLYQGNAGLSAARNTGIDYLKSMNDSPEYLCFLDSDDYYESDSLHNLLKKCIDNNLDILEFSAESFYENAELELEFDSYKTCYTKQKKYTETYDGIEYLSMCITEGDFIPSACLKVYRCDFIFDNKLRFHDAILHEDNLFSILCFLNARKVAYTPERAYKRRVRAESLMTSSKSFKNVDGYFKCGIESIRELQKHPNLDDNTTTALATQIDVFIDAAARDLKECSQQEVNEGLLCYSPADRALFYSMVQRRCEITTDLMKKDQTIKNIENNLYSITSSKSFKLGRMITKLPRMIKSLTQ